MKSPANPYVGPRAFLEHERLYGRNRELADLMDLLIAERIVLLYSPSGAGKSSLLQAGLIPAMKARGFAIPRVIRVNSAPPAGAVDGQNAPSRYALSMMASLQLAGRPTDLGALTLNQYLDRNPNGELLVFDQFEEVITTDPFDQEGKARFFDEIGEVLRARGRWAVFAMREDYLARLDPFLRHVPTRLSNTFRLDLLSFEASLEAIRNPAINSSDPIAFTAAATEKLARDLSTLNTQVDGRWEAQSGQFVEPVQLQVACFDLWERLAEGTREIGTDDIEKVGNVDQALGAYYAGSVKETAEAQSLAERVIRVWFGEQLINRQGVRAQVLKGQGLDSAAVDLLEQAHLVRSESRMGSTWVELAHDRLIGPVRENNARWFEQNLSELQKRAELWDQQRREPGLLLGWPERSKLGRWEKEGKAAAGSVEDEFVKASKANVHDIGRKKLLTKFALAAGLVALVALVFTYVFLKEAQKAEEQAQKAERDAKGALHAERTAESEAKQSDEAKTISDDAKRKAEIRSKLDEAALNAQRRGEIEQAFRSATRFNVHDTKDSSELFYVQSNGLIMEEWGWSNKGGGKNFDGVHASQSILQADEVKPLARRSSWLAGFWDDVVGADTIFYIGNDAHIHEVTFPGAYAKWTGYDLTALTGAPAAAGDMVAAHATPESEEVFYLIADGTLQELSSSSHDLWSFTQRLNAGTWRTIKPTSWTTSNLSHLAGNPVPPDKNSPLIPFIDSQTNPPRDEVYYKDTQGHIHGLWSTTPGHWHATEP